MKISTGVPELIFLEVLGESPEFMNDPGVKCEHAPQRALPSFCLPSAFTSIKCLVTYGISHKCPR